MDGTELKEHILSEYQREYKHCLISLKLAKKIVNKKFIEATRPPRVVARLRGKWLTFFSHEEFHNACRACRGACCSGIYHTSPRIIELFYILWQNPAFQLPKPDWQFLKAEVQKPTVRRWRDSRQCQNSYPCLFLSKNGCLLENSRSNTCLFNFECRVLKLRNGVAEHDSRAVNKDWRLAEKELIIWSRRIMDYFGIKSDGNLTGYNLIIFNYIVSPKSPGYLIDLLGNKSGTKKMFEETVLCPRDGVGLRKVQKAYKGKFYLLFQCPVCLAVAPVFVSSSKLTDVPEAINIDDGTMAFIESIRD